MVKTSCIVYGCLCTTKLNKDLRFFRLPLSDERRKLWLETIKRTDLMGKDETTLKNKYICSLHFEENMFAKKNLKKTAAPTLCLPKTPMFTTCTQTEGEFLQVVPSQCIESTVETKGALPEELPSTSFGGFTSKAAFTEDEHSVKRLKREGVDIEIPPKENSQDHYVRFQEGCKKVGPSEENYQKAPTKLVETEEEKSHIVKVKTEIDEESLGHPTSEIGTSASLLHEEIDISIKEEVKTEEVEIEVDAAESASCQHREAAPLELYIGRRLIAVTYFLVQLQKISRHSLTCAFGDLKINKEVKNGSASILTFECSTCSQTFEVSTDSGSTSVASEILNLKM